MLLIRLHLSTADGVRSLPRSAYHNPCLQELDGGFKIVVGNAGDHLRVLSLLTQHYQSSLNDDFQSRLDEPTYEPTDRMLIVRGSELIGHAQLSRQSAWFDRERVPVTALRDFVVLPELHSAGLRQSLLQSAEEMAVTEGGVVGLARPEDAEFFAAQGWIACAPRATRRPIPVLSCAYLGTTCIAQAPALSD